MPNMPNADDPYVQDVKRITLEKTKVAAHQCIGSQVLNDMELRAATDFLGYHLAFLLEAHMLSHKDGTDEQYVWADYEAEALYGKYRMLAGSAIWVGLSLGALALQLYWLTGLFAGLAWFMPFLYVALTPQWIKGSKQFVLKATKWSRFPQNTIVFPKKLGSPVVHIEVDAKEAPADSSKSNRSKLLLWGQEHEIKYRSTKYHGPEVTYKTPKGVWLAEIIVGNFPYAAWGLTKEDAYYALRIKMKRIEHWNETPPADTTTWHIATSGGI